MRQLNDVAFGRTSSDLAPNLLTLFAFHDDFEYFSEQYRGLNPVHGLVPHMYIIGSLSRNFLTFSTKYASLAEISRPVP